LSLPIVFLLRAFRGWKLLSVEASVRVQTARDSRKCEQTCALSDRLFIGPIRQETNTADALPAHSKRATSPSYHHDRRPRFFLSDKTKGFKTLNCYCMGSAVGMMVQRTIPSFRVFPTNLLMREICKTCSSVFSTVLTVPSLILLNVCHRSSASRTSRRCWRRRWSRST